MSIKHISTEELRRMNSCEGLIFMACGGNPQEWMDSINRHLTDDGILLNGTKLENAFVFMHGKFTNLYLPFDENVEINMEKFTVWRQEFCEQFFGTWLSDYVDKRLGGFLTEEATEQKKPDCKLISENGNIYNLAGIASETLKRNGMVDQAKEMCDHILSSGSYDEALCIINDYVNITGDDESEDESQEIGGIQL